jgi:hypothetical protein
MTTGSGVVVVVVYDVGAGGGCGYEVGPWQHGVVGAGDGMGPMGIEDAAEVAGGSGIG